MSCNIINSIPLECRNNIGGIQAVFISNHSDNFYFFPAAGLIPIISFSPSTENTFYTFSQNIETASYEENIQESYENGTSYFIQKLSIKLYKLSASTNEMINSLGKGLYDIIFLDNNGNYFLPGAFNQMRVVESSVSSGKMMGDLSGATIVFEGKEKKSAFQVSTAAAQFAIVKDNVPTPIGQLIGTTIPFTLSLTGQDSDILYDGVFGGTWLVDNGNISTIVFPTAPARLGIYAVSVGTSSVSYTIGSNTVSQIITIIP